MSRAESCAARAYVVLTDRLAGPGVQLMRRSLRRGVLPAMFFAVLCTFGPPARAVDESFFVDKVYPVLFSVQCNRCHNDNGVGSETRLEFPHVDAGKEQITAFGLKLI